MTFNNNQKIGLIFLFVFGVNVLFAQKPTKIVSTSSKAPKLVVGVVVDQMRYDFLYRYKDKYGKGGFNRLMNQGFNCKNLHYNYAPTVTAAGHSAIFTGSVPNITGIVGNEWYSRTLGRVVYCAEDTTVKTVGTNSSAGKMSPRNLLTSTISDQLRIATVFKNKTIGIALKDRGAIMPAGHTANAAYWFDALDGSWITSSFYMTELPQWVKDYNALKEANKFINTTWNTLLPIEKYTESEADMQKYEGKLYGETSPTFPHELVATRGNIYETLKSTPFGNTLTKNFAMAAIDGENLGGGDNTDFLTVSFSSPDYAGHAFGPYSVEVEDIYLRLDRDIEELLNKLDKKLGQGNYLFFLSADHAVADVPGFWQKNRLPAGVKNLSMNAVIKAEMQRTFADSSLFLSADNSQIYLNYKVLGQRKLSIDDVFKALKPIVMAQDGVADFINLHDMNATMLPNIIKERIVNGFNAQRSGDFMVLLQPQWFQGRPTGTTHGTVYNYDTHVPALFFGWGVPKGESIVPYSISDIAPTVANMLHILEGSGNIGKPISFK